MSAKTKINDVLKGHNLVHIATIDEDGVPCVRGVDFAAEDGGNCLYFMTHKSTRKVQHIRNNNKVAFAIDHDCPSWEMLQELIYIKGTGVATLVDDPQEMQKIFGLMMQKLPFLKNLPFEPTDMVGVRVDFNQVLVTDNTVQFGNTETVAY